MDAIYLYLELVALALLAWLCRDKFRPLVVRQPASGKDAQAASKPLFMFRPQRHRAPLQSRRLRHNRSSFAR